MSKARALRWAYLLGTAATLALVVHGALTVAGGGSGWSSAAERVAVGALQVVAGAAMAIGLALSKRAPRLGPVLVAIGVVAISALWYWFVIVTIPVGVGLIAIAYLRGRASPPGRLPPQR